MNYLIQLLNFHRALSRLSNPQPARIPGFYWLRRLAAGLLFFACLAIFTAPALAQVPTPNPDGDQAPLEAPDRVEIDPTARDEEIEERRSIPEW